ncbi:MAG: potassium channel family protein [Bacilli bacterium]|jgi:trk system potassium uptake protein TrkA
MRKRRSYLVIGLGQFGLSIVEELVKLDRDVTAIDIDSKAIEKVADLIPTAFVADSTDEQSLREIGVEEFTNAIVCYGDNDVASILTTALLKDLGVEHITVRMDNDVYIDIIKKLGADEIVTPQRLAGVGLANRIGNEDFLDYYNLGGTFSVVKITIRDDFQPTSILELDARNQYGINIILIQRGLKIFAPRATDRILPADIIHVVGKRRDIEDFGDLINREQVIDAPKKAKKGKRKKK